MPCWQTIGLFFASASLSCAVFRPQFNSTKYQMYTMKILHSMAGSAFILIILFSLETSVTACRKENTIYVQDTVFLPDTATCNCYDLADGLVAYYNFNNGNLDDSSGKGNHILFSNAVKTADRFGRANNAYLFNGASSFMRVANSASLNPGNAITLMAIVKMNGFNNGFCHGNQVLNKGRKDDTTGVYSLRVADLVSDCYIMGDTSKETAFGFYGDVSHRAKVQDVNNFVRSGEWVTMTFTYDGLVSKFYINGQLRGVSEGNAVFTPTASALLIGRAEDDAHPYWWNGAIDEIRIYNKALAQEAVKQLNNQRR